MAGWIAGLTYSLILPFEKPMVIYLCRMNACAHGDSTNNNGSNRTGHCVSSEFNELHRELQPSPLDIKQFGSLIFLMLNSLRQCRLFESPDLNISDKVRVSRQIQRLLSLICHRTTGAVFWMEALECFLLSDLSSFAWFNVENHVSWAVVEDTLSGPSCSELYQLQNIPSTV